jgi:hypothetical protein
MSLRPAIVILAAASMISAAVRTLTVLAEGGHLQPAVQAAWVIATLVSYFGFLLVVIRRR